MTHDDPTPQARDILSEPDLHALADGLLPPRRAREVEAAAAREGWAADLLAATRGQNQLLQMVGRGLGEMDTQRFAPALQRNLADVLDRRRRQRRRWAGGVAAAAALGGVVVTGWTVLDQELPVRSARLETPEFPFGGAFVTPAGTLPAGDGMESLAWLSRQMPGEAIHLTDLEQLGFQLASGRVLKNASSPAVHLVFEDKSGKPISLYVGIVSQGVRAAFTQVPEGSLSLHWRQGRLIFALVGDVDSPRLVEVMARISAGVVKATGNPVPAPVNAPAPILPQDPVAQPLQKAVLPADTTAVRPVAPVAPESSVPAASNVAPVEPESTPVAPSGRGDQKVL